MNFSIIIPVYNVEPYLNKCLDSVLNQTYQKYEVIIVCDKSNDKSEEIVDKYIKEHKKFKKIYAENTGLARARNIGIKQITGDYILFLDSDDYLELNCLEVIKNNLEEDLEVLRFQVQNVINKNVIKYEERGFEKTTGIEAFYKIFHYHFIENVWCYCYKTSFWQKNKFMFMDNCIAEDFGLTPLVLAKASKVKSISYIGYNYRQRQNSIMTNNNYPKKIKKMQDMLKQANKLRESLEDIPETNLFLTFIGNSLIYYSTTLKYKDYRKYKRYIKKEGFYNYLIRENWKHIIRNFLIKTNAYLYYKFIAR